MTSSESKVRRLVTVTSTAGLVQTVGLMERLYALLFRLLVD